MRRNVYLLGLTSLLNDLSSEGIYSVLPNVVGDASLIGLIGGMFNGLSYMIKPFSGYVSDRFGRAKPLVAAGYLISSISKLAMGVLSNVLIPFAVLLDRVGKGIRDAPRDSLLVLTRERGWAFSTHRALDTVGAVLGTLVSATLVSYLGVSPRAVLILLAAVSFLAILPLLFVEERARKGEKERFPRAVTEASSELHGILPLAVLIGLGTVAPALYIGRANEVREGLGIALYVLFNVAYILSALYLGKKSDSWGRKKVLELGLAMGTAAYLTIWREDLTSLTLSFVLYGAAFGTLLPTLFAIAGDLSKGRLKGTGMGVLQSIFGVSVLLSSVLAGQLISYLGYGVLPAFILPNILAIALLRTIRLP